MIKCGILIDCAKRFHRYTDVCPPILSRDGHGWGITAKGCVIEETRPTVRCGILLDVAKTWGGYTDIAPACMARDWKGWNTYGRACVVETD